ncbi:hypothetical protein OG523_10810 [Streptomyces virginiae]|uniref:hypothetical protein n=1 Tax=Streptomyces virginiae TaxID=1961 RepID=UPI002E352B78|nr:hypothetical protein [Streptomyces virginiae]
MLPRLVTAVLGVGRAVPAIGPLSHTMTAAELPTDPARAGAVRRRRPPSEPGAFAVAAGQVLSPRSR